MQIQNINPSQGAVTIGDVADQDGFLNYLQIRNFVEDDEFSKSLQSGDIFKLINAGLLAIVGVTNPSLVETDDSDNIIKIVNWINAGDVYIQFMPATAGANAYAGTHAVDLPISLAITNGVGVVDTFSNGQTVVVTITGGTATGKQIRYQNVAGVWQAYSAGPVTVPFVNGVATISVIGTAAGNITLGLSGGNTSLDKSDTAIVTLS